MVLVVSTCLPLICHSELKLHLIITSSRVIATCSDVPTTPCVAGTASAALPLRSHALAPFSPIHACTRQTTQMTARRVLPALAALCLALCAVAGAGVRAQERDLSEGLARCLLTPEMLAG